MKSEIQKLEGLNRKLHVEVPAEIVTATLDRMYKEVQKKAKFNGFRPGKAPIDKVKTAFKSEVEYDVADRIIREHYGKALDQHDIDPISAPAIDFEPIKENAPFKFTAQFEVRPEVQIKKFKGLEVEKEIFEFQEDELGKILENLRASRAVVTPVTESRPAKLGDMAIIDFEGKINGQGFEGGRAQEHMIELGSKQFIEGFEEGVVGMNVGESKTLHLKFPEAYHEKTFAGQPVDFDVTLKDLKAKSLPPLDDEFAKGFGQHDSLEQLKTFIKNDIVASEEKRIQDELKSRVLQALVAANPFEVPQSMVKEQKDLLIEDVHGKMKRDGMSEEQFKEYTVKWDKEFNESAHFIIASSMLINTIAKNEGLLATEEEFNQKMEKYAEQTGMELEKIRAFYSKGDNRSRVMYQITEEKVMQLVIAEAKIKELPKSKLK